MTELTDIKEAQKKLVKSNFVMGDPTDMIKDIYNKLEMIMVEINKLKVKK